MLRFLQYFVVFVLFGHLVYTVFNTQPGYYLSDSAKRTRKTRSQSNDVRITARDIVEHSFAETYAHLVKHCEQTGNSNKEKEMKQCMKEVYEVSKSSSSSGNNGNMTTFPFPWWFHTILRDGSDAEGTRHFLFGPWHTLETNKPNLRMCTIEKVATTQWRDVFVAANGGKNRFAFKPANVSLRPPPDAPKFVFLRDPLERFLSAFINKCVDSVHEQHCEPLAVFHNQTTENAMLRGLLGDKQRLFAAYVDTVPLSWNVHFFPQALYCNGLYRFLDEYDFIGYMAKSRFRNDLDKVGKRYGSKFNEFVRTAFRVAEKQRPLQQSRAASQLSSTRKNSGFGGGGHETSSSSHVVEYYTPRTLRRVLEYVSVDYMLLGLDIPEWANEMLLRQESG